MRDACSIFSLICVDAACVSGLKTRRLRYRAPKDASAAAGSGDRGGEDRNHSGARQDDAGPAIIIFLPRAAKPPGRPADVPGSRRDLLPRERSGMAGSAYNLGVVVHLDGRARRRRAGRSGSRISSRGMKLSARRDFPRGTETASRRSTRRRLFRCPSSISLLHPTGKPRRDA